MTVLADQLTDPRVAVDAVSRYEFAAITESLHKLAASLGWSGSCAPFGNLIARGVRVVVKPNFVTHANQGPWSIEPLITHGTVVKAVVEAALRSDPAALVIGDAPVQGCDMRSLLNRAELTDWSEDLMRRDARFLGIQDFRRTISVFNSGVRRARENVVAINDYVLFDLGHDSLLEPISRKPGEFRVTCYDPALMARTHAPGRHQYLIARKVLEADVVINVPKLKTHKKAGVTCALKNMVGANGNKEFLPHHRIGGTADGGDCYPNRDLVKRAIEAALDRENSSRSPMTARVWHIIANQFARLSRLLGDRLGVEGSWAGNDTVWRMALDINRIVLYGRPDGSLANVPQRRMAHIVDAIVAGQGDGPLAPQPLELGLLLAGNNPAAVDWVAADLLGFDQQQVAIVREAFSAFTWALVGFEPERVSLAAVSADARSRIQSAKDLVMVYPAGWLSATRRGTAAAAPVLDRQEA